jgi:uncharacterized membrane-anchored protein YhcB (DUF1043 family)
MEQLETYSFWTNIFGTVTAGLLISIILGIVWMRKAIADQKEDQGLMKQRMEFQEEKLSKFQDHEEEHYKDLGEKMDKTLAVLIDIKLAFSEVRIKNESNEKRLDRIESQAS